MRSISIKGWIIGLLVLGFVAYDMFVGVEVAPESELKTVIGKLESVTCYKGNLDGFKLNGINKTFSAFHFPKTSCEQAKKSFEPNINIVLKYPEKGTSIYWFSANEKVLLTYNATLASKKNSRYILYLMALVFILPIIITVFRNKKI